MQNLGDLFCPICLDYFAKPVTAFCGHSFCQFCLEQYFLHFESCPLCEIPIRKQKTYRANALANFVQNFIASEHKEYIPAYEQKIQRIVDYKQEKSLDKLKTGQLVDIRDQDYFWRIGRIIRIISRVGQSHKFIKVLFLDCEQKIEEDLKINSERLAKPGFYTDRDDIPKYEPIKNKNGKN